MADFKVSGVVFFDGERCFTVRKRGTTRFMLVGGKPEPGEDALECARREVSEEVGIDLAPDDLELIGCFEARAANEPGRTIESTVFRALRGRPDAVHAEIEEFRWTDIHHPPIDIAPLLRDFVFPILCDRMDSPS